MTERRTTLSLKWRPVGAPARRRDDFVEDEGPALDSRITTVQRPRVALARVRRDIDSRLENWARWCTSSEGGIAAACMTGAICEVLRKASIGALPAASSANSRIDTADAAQVGRAMVRLDLDQRRLLGLHYVDGERSSYIAALLRFPRLDFDQRMERAKDVLDEVLTRLSSNSNSQ